MGNGHVTLWMSHKNWGEMRAANVTPSPSSALCFMPSVSIHSPSHSVIATVCDQLLLSLFLLLHHILSFLLRSLVSVSCCQHSPFPESLYCWVCQEHVASGSFRTTKSRNILTHNKRRWAKTLEETSTKQDNTVCPLNQWMSQELCSNDTALAWM